jgi:hypothetical protein
MNKVQVFETYYCNNEKEKNTNIWFDNDYASLEHFATTYNANPTVRYQAAEKREQDNRRRRKERFDDFS